MPIGVPRIIYCWGEELPAQWTDIYNFIFRRRMIFLMQYLDDELCNQICGLLINIHMEDRSKELEKKEMEKSNIFKSSSKTGITKSKTGTTASDGSSISSKQSFGFADKKSIQDLLTAEEDLAIDENYKLEQYTLQKITLDWLNWTANFFDYANEPYLFYLTEILAKDFISENGNLLYNFSSLESNLASFSGEASNAATDNRSSIKEKPELALLATYQQGVNKANSSAFLKARAVQADSPLKQLANKKRSGNSSDMSQFMGIFKAMVQSSNLSNRLNQQTWTQEIFDYWTSWTTLLGQSMNKNLAGIYEGVSTPDQSGKKYITASSKAANTSFGAVNEVMGLYSPFRFLANFALNDLNLTNLLAASSSFDIKNKKSLEGTKLAGKLLQQLQHSSSFALPSVTASAIAAAERSSAAEGKQGKDKGTANNVLNKEFIKQLAQKQYSLTKQTHKNLLEVSKKALSQRTLKNEYRQDKVSFKFNSEFQSSSTSLDARAADLTISNLINSNEKKLTKNGIDRFKIKNAKNYLNLIETSGSTSLRGSYGNATKTNRKDMERTFSYRKQAERTLQDEELKKVFVIINSFGGSVGNGITVHDALQFIKAGSLTLALGVAASAASLALAGGTIGERYITEGCHTMIHQPEGSINGQASDILIDSNEIMKIRLDVAEIYSLSTYRPRHKILRDLDRDFYLTATETVYYGLADEIATNEIMQEIIEMTNKVWDYHESQQQRLLESRESATYGLDTQTQN